MDDSCIVTLYWNRDPDALKESDRKYGAYCFAIAHRILHSHEDSEECVNETWLRAWNAIPPQRPQRLSLFLAKITRNLAFDAWSARSAQKRGSGDIYLVFGRAGGMPCLRIRPRKRIRSQGAGAIHSSIRQPPAGKRSEHLSAAISSPKQPQK